MNEFCVDTCKPCFKSELPEKRHWWSPAPVALAYNPSYLRGRDQEDGGLKPAWASSLEILSLKYP
jgi:hypothetical protein